MTFLSHYKFSNKVGLFVKSDVDSMKVSIVDPICIIFVSEDLVTIYSWLFNLDYLFINK
jgi:hypothetical protein